MTQAVLGSARSFRVGGYRSDTSLHHRLGRLMAARRRELRGLSVEVEQVYARRLGRVYGAAFGVAAFCAAMLVLAVEWAAFSEPRISAVIGLVAVWPLALLGNVAARLWAPRQLRAELLGWIEHRTYPERDMARLQEQSTKQRARALVESLQLPSLAWPLVLLSLALPLSIHLLVSLMANQTLPDFAKWMGSSALIVGHAHVVLAVMSHRALKKMCHEQQEPNGWRILLSTVIASAIPGALLLLLPPLITAATGLLFIPAMFGWAKRAYRRDRALLAMAERGAGGLHSRL